MQTMHDLWRVASWHWPALEALPQKVRVQVFRPGENKPGSPYVSGCPGCKWLDDRQLPTPNHSFMTFEEFLEFHPDHRDSLTIVMMVVAG